MKILELKQNIFKENEVTADKIRDELLKDGIKLIDGRDGTTYEFITK